MPCPLSCMFSQAWCREDCGRTSRRESMEYRSGRRCFSRWVRDCREVLCAARVPHGVTAQRGIFVTAFGASSCLGASLCVLEASALPAGLRTAGARRRSTRARVEVPIVSRFSANSDILLVGAIATPLPMASSGLDLVHLAFSRPRCFSSSVSTLMILCFLGGGPQYCQ